MMRSMFAGVSGLRNHQLRMDSIGNNIANVNTVGYKSGRVTFQESFAQTLRGASAPTGTTGGTNPQQIGLGMTVGSIDNLHTQGSLQPTGKDTDMAIQGSGFFLVKEGNQTYLTRAGIFDLDSNGYLVDPSGLRVQGWRATNGAFPAKDQNNTGDIRIPLGENIPARATGYIGYAYNLDSETPVGTTITKSVDVFDSLGNLHNVKVDFAKTDANEWSWEAFDPTGTSAGSGDITFTNTGMVESGGTGNVSFAVACANNLDITLDFSNLTQAAAETTISPIERDGYPMGALESYTIDSSGIITGIYSNGLSQDLAQVALASFANPAGLIKSGNNLYRASNNSGLMQVGPAGTGGRGSIAPSSLEMSNVDLSQEFTDMITTQRGFQANSRIITTSDEMLQELVNLKR